jgi:hypothetical protein
MGQRRVLSGDSREWIVFGCYVQYQQVNNVRYPVCKQALGRVEPRVLIYISAVQLFSVSAIHESVPETYHTTYIPPSLVPHAEVVVSSWTPCIPSIFFTTSSTPRCRLSDFSYSTPVYAGSFSSLSRRLISVLSLDDG